VRRTARWVTSVVLAGIAAVHMAWGFGSWFPFGSKAELADAVVGSHDVNGPGACHAVASALLVASGLVADVPIGPRSLRRAGRLGVITVLTARGLTGVFGRTDLLFPRSTSPSFRRLDRRLYGPLCLALAAGAATSNR
jgi:hypothetical protein